MKRFNPIRHAARHPFPSAVLRGKRDRKQREREVQYFVPTIYANLWNTDMSFREMVAMCLVKDLKKRNRAKKLSADLPPLWNRVKANLSLKDAAELALKKMPSAE
ncbi:uncharacterized protein [Coffea arabica]|uniref:Uncharacterized protein isoform X2 n=1 Tax=Coffea arabica TaxID=13443 RepID=A0ABM4UV90_COFAR